MPALDIQDGPFAALSGKAVVVTGGSSGIGLATVRKLVHSGALVVSGDLQSPADAFPAEQFTFKRTDVTAWSDLVALFKEARRKHGRIDHVFANAGISNYRKESYLDFDLDQHGDPVEPDHRVLQVNIMGVMNTTKLALHHLQTQSPPGGSIVITGSGSSYGRFGLSEYTTSKHAVLGFMRSLHDSLQRSAKPIRVNLVAPGFTDTPIIETDQLLSWGFVVQPAEIVARSVAYLMANSQCDQHVIASVDSHYWEIEAELLAAGRAATGNRGVPRTAEGEARGTGVLLDVQRLASSASGSGSTTAAAAAVGAATPSS